MLSNGDFAFELNQSNKGKGLEARMLAIRNPGGLTFALYVDGKFIPEHLAPRWWQQLTASFSSEHLLFSFHLPSIGLDFVCSV
jgi:hypothetical protein